jgi:hypothetical protein
MSNYGRNFELTVPPHGRDRKGRFYNAQGAAIPIGAPVEATNGAANALGLEPVTLATGSTTTPQNGRGGIAVYEYGPNAYSGDDPALTTYSDKDTVPDAAAVQVVSGDYVKVRFTNTTASTFLNTRAYTGRTMVAGIGATTTLAVGEYLGPGAGTDALGYWQEEPTASEAWLVITKIDATRSEVEAQMVF